jgi:hypothetical protein
MIQLPGSDPQPAPELPVDMLDPQPADVVDGGQPLEGTDEPVQVAGVAGALKGVIGRVLKKGEKAAEKGAETATDAEKAATAAAPPAPPNVPPAAPEPVAPPPAPKPKITPAAPPAGAALPNVTKAKAIASELTSGAPRQIEPGRTGLRNFRSDKLNTTDDIKALIDNVAEENAGFMEARRGVVTHEQTAIEAQQYSIEDLLLRQPAETWNSAQLKAGRDILIEMSNRIDKASALIDSGRYTPEDLLSFQQMVARHEAIQEVFMGAAAEAGRALNILKTVSASGARLRHAQILEALDAAGGQDGIRNLARAVQDAKGDPKKIAKVVQKQKGWATKAGDIITEIRINGMLSNPITPAINIGANTATTVGSVPERAVAGLIGMMHGGEKVYVGEAAEMMFGLFSGYRDAWRAMARAWSTGLPSDAVSKIETVERRAIAAKTFNLDPDSMAGKGVDLFGEFIRLPGRAMMASDEAFKVLGYRMEVGARAYREAAEKGLTGAERAQLIAQRIDEPLEDVHFDAQKFARYITLQESLSGPGAINTLGRAAMQAADARVLGFPAGRLVFPFIKTPTNSVKVALERLPIAPLTDKFWMDVQAGGAARDLALARWSMGASAAVLVAAMSRDGLITGGGPANPKLKATMMASGWRPYSIFTGDGYIPINRLDPLGQIIGATADAREIIDYSDDEETAGTVGAAITMGFANALVNKTYMQSAADLLDTIGNPEQEKRLWRYFSGQATSFLPYSGMMRFVRQMTDDTKRLPTPSDPLTLTMDHFANITPGKSSRLAPDVDMFGEEVELPWRAGSSVLPSKAEQDPTLRTLIQYGVAPGKPQTGIAVTIPGIDGSVKIDLNKVDKDGWLTHDYREKAGQIARKKVEEVLRDPEFKALTKNATETDSANLLEARQMLSDAFRHARIEAVEWLVQARPEVLQAARDTLLDKGPGRLTPLPTHLRDSAQ